MEKLDVLYEDNQIIVVIKPHNVPSQEDESGDMDLLTMVKSYVKEKYNKEGEAFIGLVHRLDRPTGGIMVFARNSKSAARLSEQFANHTIRKTYYAITTSQPALKMGHLTNYLKKDLKENKVKIVSMSDDGAKKAELDYKVLETKDELSLLQVIPTTGRGHQIRVQLAGINCPIYGDNKYGKDGASTKNLALWAGKLELVHPTTKEKMKFVCPPEDVKPWSNFYMKKYINSGV